MVPGSGRRPNTPQNDAGMRIDPPKSVPCASAVMPVATATAAPPLDPPDVRVRSHGLRVGPHSRFVQAAPKANSGVLVLPIMTAPARRRRATDSAS